MSGTNTVLGAGNTTFSGTPNNDTVLGSAGANTVFGNAGNDTIDAGLGNDSIAGGAGNDTILGNGGNDTLFGQGGNDSILGGDGSDLVSAAGSGTVYGGVGSDTISLEGSRNFGSGGDPGNNAAQSDTYIIYGDQNTVLGGNAADTIYMDSSSGGNSIDLSTQTDSLVVNGPIEIIQQGSGPNGVTIFRFTGTGADTTSNTIIGLDTIVQGTVPPPICFAAGTDILTDQGEIMVQELKTGDLVATVSGRGAPMKPILWVGRRRITLAGNPNAHLLAPVRIKAGALGDCTPHRDLLVSPDHCLYLDGVLVPARVLVNGTSIVAEQGLPEVTYYHVELEQHDVLLAHGAAAESWLDADNRAWFENASVAALQVTDAQDAYGTGRDERRVCAPVVQGGEKLAAIRDTVALRAAAAAEPVRQAAVA
ncbi:Hint domain-containing protein [Falsiroseomonas sp. HW251]|uniref:Hint domain-containing protein n=1 Tax=Falsiroseomonas sp. HW251 TaxID=3390998 RepID=UPI003D323D53